ncbi:MAG: T9SS type A sorting domain-containing protein [Candidatus Electryonea clarkiae]|nr:T9SS type A sorting domain-containing protein [Candidatus Electryonea clarkiae]MDP8287987.1 T9SS type A sorting domain-containing protein [Candidatus Electryonea clarkiae]
MRLVDTFRNLWGLHTKDVVLVDNYAYVISGLSGLIVVDISDPTNPVIDAGHVWIPTNCIFITKIDTFLYVLGRSTDPPNNQSGIYIFDISDRTNPELIERYRTTGYGMANNDSLLFVVHGDKINIFSLENPQHPDTVSSTEFEDFYPGDIVLEDTVTFLLSNDGILLSLSFDDPSSPAILDTLEVPEDGRNIDIMDNLIVISSGIQGMSFVDASNPENLQLLNTVDYETSIRGAKFIDDYVFAISRHWDVTTFETPDTIYIMDVDNLEDPEIINRIPVTRYLDRLGFEIDEEYLYLCDQDDCLRIFDIEDITNPVQIGSTDRPYWIASSTIVDNIIYGIEYDKMWMLDISDPSEARFLGSTFISPFDAYMVDSSDDFLWIVSGGDIRLYKARILDQAPWFTVVDSLDILEGSRRRDILVNREDDVLYYCRDNNMLGVLDIPTNTVVDTIEINCSTFTKQNDLLFVRDRFETLFIFSLDDPMHPELIGSLYIEGSGYWTKPVIYQNSLYFTSSLGFVKINVEDPENPEFVGSYLPDDFEVPFNIEMYGPYLVFYEGYTNTIVLYDLISADPEEWSPVAWHRATWNFKHHIDVHEGYIIDDFTIYQPYNLNDVDELSSGEYGNPDISISVYPNPFNESVTINYTLPQTANVVLSVHNLLGQQVARVSDRRLSQGSHLLNWTPSDQNFIASGIYFIRLTTPVMSKHQRVILLR